MVCSWLEMAGFPQPGQFAVGREAFKQGSILYLIQLFGDLATCLAGCPGNCNVHVGSVSGRVCQFIRFFVAQDAHVAGDPGNVNGGVSLIEESWGVIVPCSHPALFIAFSGTVYPMTSHGHHI